VSVLDKIEENIPVYNFFHALFGQGGAGNIIEENATNIEWSWTQVDRGNWDETDRLWRESWQSFGEGTTEIIRTMPGGQVPLPPKPRPGR
jgi:hypothetical protein